LEHQYPNDRVQSERYLRTADGKIAKDPLTGQGRRLDNVVIRNKQVIDAVETTSPDAPKDRQMQKEDRIRENGGNYIRDKETREIIPVVCESRQDRRC